MSKLPNIEHLIHKDSNGNVGVLFVLPFLKRDFDAEITSAPGHAQFFKLVGKVIPGYAAMTLKRTPGMWKDDVVEEKIKETRHRIDEAIQLYRPGAVVFLGVNFAKRLIPEIHRSTENLNGRYYKYTLTGTKKTVTAMVWSAPDKLINDSVEEFVRFPETLSTLWFHARRKRYNDKPEIVNLNTYKAASEYVDFLGNEHEGMIGFDTETYSLNRVHHQRLGSMQFCTDAYKGYVLLWDSKHQEMSPKELKRLTPKLVHLFGSKETKLDAWIMHNGMFDIAQTRSAFGVRTYKPVLDSLLFSYLMDENRKFTHRIPVDIKNGPYSLKVLVQEFLAFFHYNAETMKARSDGTLMELPLPDFLEYAGFDPVVTWRMYDVFLKWAKTEKYDEKALRLLRHLCSPSMKMYENMTRNGMRVDETKLRQLLSKKSIINARLAEIREGYKEVPEIKKVNEELFRSESDSQLSFRVPWIFNMQKDVHKKQLFFHSRNGFKYKANKDEKFSADKKFQKEHKNNPVIALYTEAQGLSQLRNLYIRPIYESMFLHPKPTADTCDGRAHPNIKMHGTVTGRVTQNAPNCAQVPRSDSPAKKEIKSLYYPESGKIYIQCDLASAEVRVLGGISEDKEICRLSQESFDMLKHARRTPDDIKLRERAELVANFHKQTYALCYHVKPEQVTPVQRQIAKNTTFGICYGMSDQGLSAQLGVSLEDAVEIKRVYFGVYKGAAKWIEDTKKFVGENGYVETPLGRRRRVPQIFSGNRGQISEAERYAVNAPIQGTASDYAMLATMLADQEIEKMQYQEHIRLINGVYDSAVFEVTASVEWIQKTSEMLRRIFTMDVVKYMKKYFDFELKAPIDIDIEVSQKRQFKCKACSGKRYPGAGNICSAKIPTGKKKDDGSDETKSCGCKDYEVIELSGGWGYLCALEENERGYYAAAKGF